MGVVIIEVDNDHIYRIGLCRPMRYRLQKFESNEKLNKKLIIFISTERQDSRARQWDQSLVRLQDYTDTQFLAGTYNFLVSLNP